MPCLADLDSDEDDQMENLDDIYEPKDDNTIGGAESERTRQASDSTNQVLYDFTRTHEVIVGSEKVKFVVNPDILRLRSGFFQSAFGPNWNGNTNPTYMSTDDPRAFEIYLKCAINEKMLFKPKDCTPVQLVNAHILADKLCDPMAANTIINGIQAYYHSLDALPGPEESTVVFESTADASPLQRLFLDFLSRDGAYKDSFWAEKMNNDYPKALLLALVKRIPLIRYPEEDENEFMLVDEMPQCHYHLHHPVYAPPCPKDDTVDE